MPEPLLDGDFAACDCHSHIYGPYARFPLPAGAEPPPERTLADYERLLRSLGVARSVLVQPLAYGTDQSAMLDAMAALGPDRARGVAVVDPAADASELRRLSDAGVRGVRIMTEQCALTPREAPEIARRVAPLGWHLQFQGEGAELEGWSPLIAALPTPVVIDHVGRVPVGGGTRHPAFQALLRLLATGKVWVKLSAFYYGASPSGQPMAEIAERVKTLAREFPERLVWGLNWPHPRFGPDDKPDDLADFRAFLDWVGDPRLRRRILADNPASLYGFA